MPDQVPKYLKASEKTGSEAPAAARSPAPSEAVRAPAWALQGLPDTQEGRTSVNKWAEKGDSSKHPSWSRGAGQPPASPGRFPQSRAGNRLKVKHSSPDSLGHPCPIHQVHRHSASSSWFLTIIHAHTRTHTHAHADRRHRQHPTHHHYRVQSHNPSPEQSHSPGPTSCPQHHHSHTR